MYSLISATKVIAFCILLLLRLSYSTLAGELKGDTPVKPNTIEIKDFSFYPPTLTVKAGEKVTWINRDDEPHTVVSVEKQFKKSSALDTDQEFTVTVGEPGTYTYFCSVHPKMTGTIIVVKG